MCQLVVLKMGNNVLEEPDGSILGIEAVSTLTYYKECIYFESGIELTILTGICLHVPFMLIYCQYFIYPYGLVFVTHSS
jgi:hypothetical protein